MEQDSLGRLITRLAVAVIAADGRITTPELEALGRLDRLGLGSLAAVAREEIERATQKPVDVAATCSALAPLGDKATALVLNILAALVASDGQLAPREREVFDSVAGHLGVGPAAAWRILDAAISPPSRSVAQGVSPASQGGAAATPRPSVQRAFQVLGLEPGASRSALDTKYLDLVQRYDPARVSDLGAEFAALAVRRLAAITDAYEAAHAALRTSA
jgi:DnaJ-domain-containing protein 1